MGGWVGKDAESIERYVDEWCPLGWRSREGLACSTPLRYDESWAVNELVTLEIPAKAEYVVLGRLALAGLVRDRRFSPDAVADLKLALTEACSNSIRHAYNHADGQVHLSLEARPDCVVMVVRDQGGGFHEDDVDCPE